MVVIILRRQRLLEWNVVDGHGEEQGARIMFKAKMAIVIKMTTMMIVLSDTFREDHVVFVG